MVKIKSVILRKDFEDNVKRLKDSSLKERVKKQIIKIASNPASGKPLKHSLRGAKTIYIKPYRLIYTIEGNKLILLRFDHRKKVYK